MQRLSTLIHKLIALRNERQIEVTLLAVCPNSVAVLEAAVVAARRSNAPMLFAATLNQVDRDGGYTGWTQRAFVAVLAEYARKYNWDGPLYPCLDHGGQWLKDMHAIKRLDLEATTGEVKASLTAALEAGYKLLHIDPTVDKTLPPGATLSIDLVVDRTVELIVHAESERARLGLPPVDYEVGTEEVHGGLVDYANFERFLTRLRAELAARGLLHAWPCFIVAKVGTDLHTTFFDPQTAARLYATVAPLGSLIKGHYTDWVENPADYPASGMGGANVGPEFTAEEYRALADLCAKERALCHARAGVAPSDFMAALEQAVVDSGRWQKWLQPDESGCDFADLSPDRRDWLAQTGARYVWTAPAVVEARARLYDNLRPAMPDPHGYVVERVAAAIDRYLTAFNLFDSLTLLG
ncbi:MAG: class II D-tagatose-bisphosphate aldolase, non-catalytic subunit [Anaerolineae bacterium]|nr:class II D-tagatose-bisphosphate aldolase, non-catalytic subunit [Anaerolineae bacterium]